jgi:sugar phosphate permease
MATSSLGPLVEQPPSKRLVRWQIATLTLMVISYSAYYLCRATLPVLMSSIIDELAAKGISHTEAKIRVGYIASMGILAYAIGKVVSGNLADLLGGRRGLLTGMGGAIFFSVLFAMGGGIPIFTLAWVGNRAMQSMGWVSVVKLTSRWFGPTSYARVMGLISSSYLIGDTLARASMGLLMSWGLEWRAIFFIAAAALSLVFIASFLFIRNSPQDVGEEEPAAETPLAARGDESDASVSPKNSVWQNIKPLLLTRSFRIVCVLSLCLTLIRETFNTWSPTFLVERVGFDKPDAAFFSALFPFFGCLSVMAAGFIGDAVGRNGRGKVIAISIALCVGILLLLGHSPIGVTRTGSVALIAMTAMLLLGPYSYLSGAMALDFGGKKNSGTACGIIDGVGYFGGYLSGASIAQISISYGWEGAFTFLAAVALLGTLLALVYSKEQRAQAYALAEHDRQIPQLT